MFSEYVITSSQINPRFRSRKSTNSRWVSLSEADRRVRKYKMNSLRNNRICSNLQQWDQILLYDQILCISLQNQFRFQNQQNLSDDFGTRICFMSIGSTFKLIFIQPWEDGRRVIPFNARTRVSEKKKLPSAGPSFEWLVPEWITITHHNM